MMNDGGTPSLFAWRVKKNSIISCKSFQASGIFWIVKVVPFGLWAVDIKLTDADIDGV